MGNQAVKECPSGSVFIIDKSTERSRCVEKEEIYESKEFTVSSKDQVRYTNYTVYIQDGNNLFPVGWDTEYEFYKGNILSIPNISMTEKILGKGTYGQVSKSGSQELVTKVANFNNLDFINEVAAMTLLNHLYKQLSFTPEDCCIIPFYSIQYNDDKVKIITKAFPGTLQHLMKTQPSQEVIRKCFYTILKSMFFISDIATILHLDIKPDNILTGADGNCYMTDYGFSKWEFLTSLSFERNFHIQALYYKAPEVLLERKYDLSVDAWSVGITLREFFYPDEPFEIDPVNHLGNITKFFLAPGNEAWKWTNPINVDILYSDEKGFDLQKNGTRMRLKEKYDALENLWDGNELSETPMYHMAKIPIEYRDIIDNLLISRWYNRGTNYAWYLNMDIFKDYRAEENLSPLILESGTFENPGTKFVLPEETEILRLFPRFSTSNLFENRLDHITQNFREIAVKLLIKITEAENIAPIVPLVATYFLDEYLRLNKQVDDLQCLALACYFISTYLILKRAKKLDKYMPVPCNFHILIQKVLIALENNLYRLNPLIIFPNANKADIYASILVGTEMDPFEIAEWYKAKHTGDSKIWEMDKFSKLNAVGKITDETNCSFKDHETFVLIFDDVIYCLTPKEFWDSEKYEGRTKFGDIPTLSPKLFEDARKGDNTFTIYPFGEYIPVSRYILFNE